MSSVSEIKKRLSDASEKTLEECLQIAETPIILKKSKDEDNDQYVKRLSAVTEAKKKALKSAYEIVAIIEKSGSSTNGESDGQGENGSSVKLPTPENRARS